MSLPRLALPPGQVHVWMAACDQNEPRLLQRYRAEILNRRELEQEARFYFAHDRQQYLVTRALTRCVLSRYSSRGPADWHFEVTQHGRPTIANPEKDDQGLSFNISHSGNLVLVAVARDVCLGVDTESEARGEDMVAIGQSSFHAREIAELDTLPPNRRRQGYLACWTLKEAYVKAIGLGLSMALDSFSFAMKTGRRIEMHDAATGEAATGWHFTLFQPCAGQVATICCQQHEGRPPQLSFRRMCPLVFEQACEVAVLARSD